MPKIPMIPRASPQSPSSRQEPKQPRRLLSALSLNINLRPTSALSVSPNSHHVRDNGAKLVSESQVSLPVISLLPPTPTQQQHPSSTQGQASPITTLVSAHEAADTQQSVKVMTARRIVIPSTRKNEDPAPPVPPTCPQASSDQASLSLSPYPSPPDVNTPIWSFSRASSQPNLSPLSASASSYISTPSASPPGCLSPSSLAYTKSSPIPSPSPRVQATSTSHQAPAEPQKTQLQPLNRAETESTSANDNDNPRPFRYLVPSEAHQIALLLAQHLHPVRNSQKGMMRECIALSEKLDKAGVKWDKTRRVMGLHLRGIWEQGRRVSGSGGGTGSEDAWSPGEGGWEDISPAGLIGVGGTAGRMELYILGSFLTTAEEPHPLDTTPLSIPTSASIYLPSSGRQNSPYSFSSSLANSSITSLLSTLPGLPGEITQSITLQQGLAHANSSPFTTLHHSTDKGHSKSASFGGEGEGGGSTMMGHKRSWKERKNVALRISTRGSSKIHPSVQSALSLISASELKWTKTPIRKAHKKIRNAAARFSVSGARNATERGLKSAAKIGFGGWEVR